MNIVFNGCSYTYGEGFSESDRIKYCYPYLIKDFFDCRVENIAIGGSGNSVIFQRTADHMHTYQNNIHVVQWSVLNRIWLYPDADLKVNTNMNDKNANTIAQRIGVSQKKIKEFSDMLSLINGDYHNLLLLVTYCTALVHIAQSTSNKIIFVDGLTELSSDLFNRCEQLSDLSESTKDIIGFDRRPDEELWGLYNTIYKCFSTLDTNIWANILHSFRQVQVDTGPLGHHPGIRSHKIFFNQIKGKIIELYEQRI